MKSAPILLVAWCAALAAALAPSQGHDAAASGAWIVKARQIVTLEGDPIESGAIRINGSTIEAIAGSPDTRGVPEAHVLDFPDGIVYPGLVDAGSYQGIRRERDDATAAFQPGLRMAESFDPAHPSFQKNFAAGVTAVHLVPGNACAVGGRTAVVKVGPGGGARVVSGDAGLKVSLVEDAYPDGRAPTSVIGTLDALRDPGAELATALVPFNKGSANVFVSAATNREVLLAAGLRSDLGFRTVLLADLGCGRFTRELKAGVAGVLLDALAYNRQPYEWAWFSDLMSSGVPVAFATGSPFRSPAALRLSAVIACRHGVSADRALRAITIDAARILGVDGSIGSLKPGKDADLLVLSGPITDARSRILLCVQDGKVAFRAPKESSQ